MEWGGPDTDLVLIIGVDLGEATPYGTCKGHSCLSSPHPPSVPLCDLVYSEAL